MESPVRVYFKYDSWTEDQGLYCDKRYIREMGKSIALFANAITCFFFLNLSDALGRKMVIFICSILVVGSLVLAYVTQTFYLKMFFVGFAYGCEGCFSSLFLFLMNEISRRPDSPDVHTKLKSKISAFSLASFSVGIVVLNLSTYVITTADNLLLGMILSLVVLLYPNFVCLKESPLWLIKQKRFREAVDVFQHIAKVNMRVIPEEFFERFVRALEENTLVTKAEDSNQKLTMFQKVRLIFATRKYRKVLMINCTVSTSLFVVYYGMTTSVQDLGFQTVQFNGILVGITQAAGFLVVLRFLANTRRKVALIFIQSNLLFGAFLLVCLSYLEPSKSVLVVQGLISAVYISTVISSMFSFLYVTNAESFPTQVRGTAVGLILLTGKLVGSVAPYINLFSKHMKVHVRSSVPLFLSLFCTMFLKETFVSNKLVVHK